MLHTTFIHNTFMWTGDTFQAVAGVLGYGRCLTLMGFLQGCDDCFRSFEIAFDHLKYK
jgi:hypothetical protein